jgi:tripartite-type tricarboxylate transporter receptor subunit TctC
MKRSVILVGLFLAIWGLNPDVPTVQAQSYPSRPIQVIVPNVAGSIMDMNARAIANELGKILGTQVVPINKPGAASALGAEVLAKSKKDGYTLGHTGNAPFVFSRILNPETIHFDTEKDLEPLGLHLIVPLAIGVQAGSPWKTFADLVEYAKTNPKAVRVSTMGVASTAHFNLEILQSLTGAQFTHVPFKGGESVITAVLGGHVEMTFDAVNKIVPHVESGKMRMLLLTNRMGAFPSIPTTADLGLKEELFYTWFAMYAPSGMPEDVKRILVPAVEKAIKSPEVKEPFEAMKLIPEYRPPAVLNRMVAEEYQKALAVANRIGLGK